MADYDTAAMYGRHAKHCVLSALHACWLALMQYDGPNAMYVVLSLEKGRPTRKQTMRCFCSTVACPQADSLPPYLRPCRRQQQQQLILTHFYTLSCTCQPLLRTCLRILGMHASKGCPAACHTLLSMLFLVQIDYAALDALCLLMLLDNMIACAPPESSALQQEPATPSDNAHQHAQTALAACADDEAAATLSKHSTIGGDDTGSVKEQSKQPDRGYDASGSDLSLGSKGRARAQSNTAHAPHVNHHSRNQTRSSQGAATRTHDNTATPSHHDSSSSNNAPAAPQAITDGTSNPAASQHAQSCNNRNTQTSNSKVTQISNSEVTQASTSHAALDSSDTAHQDASQRAADTAHDLSSSADTDHQIAIQRAAEQWGCRLEMSATGPATSKPRARRHMSRRQRAHIRHAAEQQNQIDDVAGELQRCAVIVRHASVIQAASIHRDSHHVAWYQYHL